LPSRLRLTLLALVVAFSVCLALGYGPDVLHAAPARKRSSSVAAPALHTSFGVRAVAYARRLVGVRYRWGGTTPRSGFDCSGFVSYVYRHLGVVLPHSSYVQFGLGRRVARGALRPGDLVFFDRLGHVGIYVGRGRFIHSPSTGRRVTIDSLRGWYAARFAGARRLARR